MCDSNVEKVGGVLFDKSRPLKERFRALFTLRGLGGNLALKWMLKTLENDTSELLKHEIAYVMGQMQDSEAILSLIRILKDAQMETIVRHEAGEALGALGDHPGVREALESSLKEEKAAKEVKETCHLALSRLGWLQKPEENLPTNPYKSVDPAPPFPFEKKENLEEILCNESEDLFLRYRAMFSLRNEGSPSSIKSLCKALSMDSSSPLFRHEVAYVLGQIQSIESKESLIDRLRDVTEHPMVRHECAEALGSLGTVEIENELRKYLGKEDGIPEVVRQSCEVALDFCDYNQSEEFQFANTLAVVQS